MGKNIAPKPAPIVCTSMKSVGVVPNWIPYLMKLSMIFLRFKITNIIPIKFINPLYFCVSDSPLRIEMCLTLLGINERQLLYFLFVPMTY